MTFMMITIENTFTVVSLSNKIKQKINPLKVIQPNFQFLHFDLIRSFKFFYYFDQFKCFAELMSISSPRCFIFKVERKNYKIIFLEIFLFLGQIEIRKKINGNYFLFRNSQMQQSERNTLFGEYFVICVPRRRKNN